MLLSKVWFEQDYYVTVLFSAVRVRVRVTLQLTVSQSVRHGVEPNLGLLTSVFNKHDFYVYIPVFSSRVSIT
jgi:hypothetical protein